MSDRTQIVTIPIVPGIHEDTDRSLSPPGTVIAATNARVRKGAISKANGLVDAGVQAYDGAFSGPCDALGYAAGREVAVMAGRAWARRQTGGAWVEVGRASRATPVKAHWSAFTDARSGVVQSTCAAIGNYVATAHYDGAGVQFAAMDQAGLRRSAKTFSGYYRPRLIVLGSVYVLAMQNISDGDIYGVTIDGATFAASAVTFIIATVVGEDKFDVAAFNDELFLLASRDTTTTFQVAFCDATFSLSAFQQVACNNATIFSCSVYGTDGEGIWATFDDQVAQKIAAFAEDLTSVTGAVTSIGPSMLVHPAVMTRRDASTVWVVWNEISSSPTQNLLRVAAYDTSAAVSGGAVGYAWHVHAASRPWDGSSTSVSIWLHTDPGTSPWAIQRRYTLATLVMDLDTPGSFGMFIESELSPDERANQQQSFHVPEVAFRSTLIAPGGQSFRDAASFDKTGTVTVNVATTGEWNAIIGTSEADSVGSNWLLSEALSILTGDDSAGGEYTLTVEAELSVPSPDDIQITLDYGAALTGTGTVVEDATAVLVGTDPTPVSDTRTVTLEPNTTIRAVLRVASLNQIVTVHSMRVTVAPQNSSASEIRRGFFPALATIRTQNENSVGTCALVLYEWDTESGTAARQRMIAEAGGQGLVFGGGLQELPSARINPAGIDTLARGMENNFVFSPAILSVTATATGSDGLTQDALYGFRAVFEYVSADGLRSRSAPSAIAFGTPTVGLLNLELKIATAPTSEREFSSPPNQTVVHIYATGPNGNTYQRITPDSGLTAGVGSFTSGVITYVHSVAFASYSSNEPLYTEGESTVEELLANEPAPAHRFGWTGGGYAWVAGLFNPCIIERSKASTLNEPARFTRHGQLRSLMPEEVTGGAWLDGVSVVFSHDRIYTVSTAMGPPQRLPATVGCIDWRSVVELPQGVGFQSMRGFELLPRGFGEPRLISGPVQDSLRGRKIISATVTGHAGSDFVSADRVGERLLVLFAFAEGLADPGVRLVYDLDFDRWLDVVPAMEDSGTVGEILTTWNGRMVVASRTGTTIRYESPTDWSSGELSLSLADARPFGAMARGRMHRLQLLGEVRSSSEVEATAYFDGEYSRPVPLGSRSVRGVKGDKFLVEWELPTSELSALGVDLEITGSEGTDSEDLLIHSLGIDVSPLAGRPRVGQDRS